MPSSTSEKHKACVRNRRKGCQPTDNAEVDTSMELLYLLFPTMTLVLLYVSSV